MAVFDNPSRAQFERFNVAGQAPSIGQPGSFALNVVDRKLWSFGPTGSPVLLAYDISDHDTDRSYSTGQLVVQDGALWRANTNLTPGAFDTADWTPVTAGSLMPPSEPTASGLLTGGGISLSSGNVAVAAGTGVIVDATDPNDVTRTFVSWSSQTVSVAAGGATIRIVTVDGGGTVASRAIGDAAPARRDRIVLGYAEFNDGGTLVRVVNIPRVSRQAAGDLADAMEALGGAFILDGLVLSAGTGLALDFSSGTVFTHQGRWRSTAARPNRANIAGASTAVFDVRRQSGEVVAAAQTAVPLNVYDGGAVPAGFSTVAFLFSAIDGAVRWLQLGSSLYASSAGAIAALDAEWAALPIELRQRLDAVCLGAVVTTNSGMSDLAGRVFPVAAGPQLRAVFQIPQGASGFLRTDGANAMQGPLDMASNDVQNAVIDEGVF